MKNSPQLMRATRLVAYSIRQTAKLIVSDRAWISLQYFRHFGAFPNLRRARTFNEKLILKILHDRRPALTVFADKLLARQYASKLAPELKLPTLYWCSADPTDIPLSSLPDKFVYKANHGCGFVQFVLDKMKVDKQTLIAQGKFWLKQNYYYLFREWAYKHIQPKVFAEQLLIAEDGGIPKDYKFFVFNGKVKFIQVDLDRFSNHKRNFYDRDWTQLDITLTHPAAPPTSPTPPPTNLEKMIEVAEKLSGGIDLIRVDLYEVGSDIYFGELTNYPQGGLGVFSPKEADYLFGDQLILDEYSSHTHIQAMAPLEDIKDMRCVK